MNSSRKEVRYGSCPAFAFPESVLADQARLQGVAPETLALDVLCRHLSSVAPPCANHHYRSGDCPIAAIECGVSVPDAAR